MGAGELLGKPNKLRGSALIARAWSPFCAASQPPRALLGMLRNYILE